MAQMLAKAPMDRRIAEIVTPTVEGMGFELVRVRLMAGRKITLQIMAERPDGSMEIEDCAALSRALSAVLDVEDPIEREYSLEVSSPGIDRPLTRLAHFDAHKGFLAKLETEELIGGRKRFKGELLGVDGDSVLIEADEAGRVALPFDALADARLVLTDELVAASLRRRKTEFDEAAFDDVDVEDGEPDEPSGEEPEERENA